jgi:DNA repair exonuclease SbcCD ATPase subunit
MSVRRQNLELLGKRLKSEHAAFNDGRSDFEIGCMNATVNPTEVKDLLRNKGQIFAGKYLVLLPEEHMSLLDWDGQDHHTRKLLLQGADAILSKNPKTREWALGSGTIQTAFDFIKEFKSLKSCVGGSDAHEIATIGKPDLNRFCWIKADLTFDGLKQVLHEPRVRVYIGENPPNLKNDYQVIDSVTITKSMEWFGDLFIPLNRDLVSVIGPRGSGKSALAEAIAFAGGSNLFRGSTDTKDTFLAKASKRSPSNAGTIVGTEITLNWRDGHNTSATVQQTLRTPQEEEEVKYLPQKFVEWLCAPENNHELESEIERVIYQRHQKSAQSEASNFQELRRAATQALQTRRQRLAQTIKTLNQSIAGKASQIDELPAKQAELSRRKTELDAVIKLAPSIPEENKADVENLNALQAKRQTLVEEVSQLTKHLTVLDTLTAKYEILAADIAQFNREIAELYADAGITDTDGCLVPPPPPRATDVLTERRTAINASVVALQRKGEESDDTIAGIDKQIATIKTKLTMTEAKQKEYEKNQADRKKLEAAISALEKDIKEINETIKPKHQAESLERMEAFLDAIDLLGKEMEVLQRLYQPLQDALASSNDTAKKLGFISKVVFDGAGHASRGMELFDRRKSTVRDEDELRIHLAKYFDDISIGLFQRDETRKALEALTKVLAGTNAIKEQLRKERTPREFADWIFDIDSYSVTYSLEYDKKDLKYLSPGEKGIVLLLLYLEAEEDDHRPLIIDQPDDNLDNLSIYPNLVQYFRERKQTRQIIIITHNPNLVVTTDSEQIVLGSFDGSTRPKLRYRSGSLENTEVAPDTGIKEEVCRVLEGGVVAFQIRENRYALSPE